MYLKKLLGIGLGLWVFGVSQAQILQVPERSVYYQTADQWVRGDTTYQTIDTALHRYALYEPKHRNGFGGTDLGNIGSAYIPYLVDFRRQTGFESSRNYWSRYQLSEDSIRYMSSRSPFTAANYAQGPKQFLQLELTHAQRVNKQLSVGANYYRVTSTGFFQRQNTSLYGVQFWVLLQSKNQRYRTSLSWTFNKFTNQENGGVSSDTDFVLNPITSGENVPIVFADAENRLRHHQLSWRNYYFLGGQSRATSDTTSVIQPAWVLSHTLHYKWEGWRYANYGHDSTLYDTYRFDPINTLDTMRLRKLENKLLLSSGAWDKNGKARNWFLNGGLNLEYYDFYQPEQRKYGLNAWLLAEAGIRYERSRIEFGLEQALPGGYNAGDFRYRFHAAQGLGKSLLLAIESQFQRAHPEWNTQQYFGNHIYYFQELSPSMILFNQVSLDWNKGESPYRLRFRYQTLNDPIVYDERGFPVQWDGSTTLLQTSLEKRFRLWIFYLDNRLLWQQVQGLQAVRVPELSAIESFYLQLDLFKKVLRLQVGTTVFFRSAYTPYGWNPDLRAFYLVNGPAIPAYPQADVWLSLQAKRVRGFLRFEHANMGLSDPRYYAAHLYPMSQRALRFGLYWTFYN